MPLVVSDRDTIAVGVEEGSLPSEEACSWYEAQRVKFQRGLDWTGCGKDSERIPDKIRANAFPRGLAVIVLLHRRSVAFAGVLARCVASAKQVSLTVSCACRRFYMEIIFN